MTRHQCHISIQPLVDGVVSSGPGWAIVAMRIVLPLAVVISLQVVAVSAQEMIDTRKEYNVKAVTLYTFGRYVTWPASAFASSDDPFVIGVLGPNPFGNALNKIATKKTINGRSIVVRPMTSPEEYSQCHILFVSQTVGPELEARLFTVSGRDPVLLVGESTGFAERGGVVNFYHSGSNVRFELNADTAMERHLRLSAKLLTLGKKVASR